LWRKRGLKDGDVTGEWRKLQNGELHNLCSFQNNIRQIKSRRMRQAGRVVLMGKKSKVHKVLVGKPGGNKEFRRPWSRGKDGIKMYLREIGWKGVNSIYLAQDRDRWRAVVNTVKNLQVLEPRT
jgi:hypothetical protein